MVIAQDTTYYGIDLYGRRMLAELLRRLCRIDGIEWIRLHYAYPTEFPDDVIDVMATSRKSANTSTFPSNTSPMRSCVMNRRHTKADAIGSSTGCVRRPRPRTAHDAARGLSGRDGGRFRGAVAIRRRRAFRPAGRLRLFRGGGYLFGAAFEGRCARRGEAAARGADHGAAEGDLARQQPPPRGAYRARGGRRAAGRLLRLPHAVRFARGRPGTADSRRRPPASRGCFYEARITAAEEYDLYGEIAAK